MRTHLIAAVVLLSGCATDPEPQPCTAEFTGSVCLDLGSAGPLIAHQSILEEEVERTLDVVQPLLGVTKLRIRLFADPTQIIPEIGMGGFNPGPEEVRLYADPNLPDLESVLRTHLLPQLAHEIHHAMRRRAVGYGSTLLEAAVSEGLADHFALEASGDSPPPWALALTPAELDVWVPEVVSRSTGSYNHSAWFHGTDPSIPRWTGYAVGFELVRAYLDQDSTRSASALVGEPATSFVP